MDIFEEKNVKVKILKWQNHLYADLLPIVLGDDAAIVNVGGFVFLRQEGHPAVPLSDGNIIVKFKYFYHVTCEEYL